MALIPITGVPSTYRVPGTYVQFRVAQGASTATAGEREVCLVMPQLLSGGTWTNNQLYRIRSEQDVIDGAGAGSILHRAARAFLRHNRTAKLYAVPHSPSSGTTTAAIAADLDVVVSLSTGSNPAAAGVAIVSVCGEPCQFGYDTTDTVTTIGDGLAAAINAKTWLPVTAVNSSGTVTITCKTPGIAGGDGTRPIIRVRCSVTASTNVVLQSENSLDNDFLGNAAAQAGVEGGTTAEVQYLETALATLDNDRKYYMVTSTYRADATTSQGWDYLATHITNKSAPNVGHRSVGIGGANYTLADLTADVNGLNNERINVIWQKNSEVEPWTLASAWAGIRQAGESLDAAYNFDGYRGGRQDIINPWLIPPVVDSADRPTNDDVNDAINDGITVVQSDSVGSYVVMSCNTRSKDSGGTVDDFRATETHRISIGDYVLDTLVLRATLTFANKKLADDQYLADGVTVDSSARIANGVVTPSTFRPWLIRQLTEFADQGLIVRLDDTTQSLQVLIDPNNNGRLECGYPLYTVNLMHQLTMRVDEATEG